MWLLQRSFSTFSQKEVLGYASGIVCHPEVRRCNRTCERERQHPQIQSGVHQSASETCRDSRRERRRNLNSWRMLDPSRGDAGGRRGKLRFSVSIWRSHFPFKLQFSEEPWKACLPTAIEVHRDLCAPFLLKALAAALFLFSSVRSGDIMWQTEGKGSVWDYLKASTEINDT